MPILPKKPKAERLNTRAEKKMVRAKSAYAKAEDAKKTAMSSYGQGAQLASDYANRQYEKAERMGNKAVSLKAKSKEAANKAKMKATTKAAMAAVKSTGKKMVKEGMNESGGSILKSTPKKKK
jgi:hypothetical protein